MSKPSSTAPPADVLVSLNRAVTTARLMAGAVHEVNNALQVIAGTVEMLEQFPNLPPAVAQALERLRRQGTRAAGALADVLVFTKAPLEGTARMSLREAAAHSVGLRRFAAARAGVTLELQADASATYFVVANRGQIQQAVLNLIMNAEQAVSGTGSKVTVDMEQDESRTGVRVTDTGPGIPSDLRARLFTPFVSTRAPDEGAGLGLWAAQVIAHAHGGSVVIEERPAGTSTTLWLPRADR